jgi:hypothetical protein
LKVVTIVCIRTGNAGCKKKKEFWLFQRQAAPPKENERYE